MKKINPDYLRNLIFGTEDALVSTVGVLFGLATKGNYSPSQLITAGLIVIAVEALSMGAGSFLTEESVHKTQGIIKLHKDNPTIGALIMFFSYFISGVIVLLPYIFLPVSTAKIVSIALTAIMLFSAGFLPTKNLKQGLKMVLVAGAAILVGFGIASI